MMTFTLASLSFTIIGISYSTVRSIVDKENYIYVPDMLNETKLFLHVCYEIAINIQRLTNEASNRISALLLVTNDEFQDNFNKIVYEDKYNETFDNLMTSYSPPVTKDHNLSTNSILVEHTPIGNIVMYYDKKDKCLFYYASRSPTTRQLQSVGRKFVIQFCCPQIIEEMLLEKEEEKKTPEKENTQTENKDHKPKHGIATKSGVMAKFKNNTKNSKTNTSKHTTDNSPHEIKPVNHVDNFKFLRKGPLADFSFTQKIKTPRHRDLPTKEDRPILTTSTTVKLPQNISDVIDKSQLSFSEYKKLMNMKQQNDDYGEETISDS
jgi:hypothetical protein